MLKMLCIKKRYFFNFTEGILMTKIIISLDRTKSPKDQPIPMHNRWHPDIPAVATMRPGQEGRIECCDWTGGQIKNNDSADDVRYIDLTQVHYMSGPIAVEGAQPGDLLVVEVLNIGPVDGAEWGFTGIFAKENGGGFLTDHYPEAAKAIWDFHGIYATSRHIPGIKFAGITHPGLMGCAPSAELLAQWNKRESILKETDPHRVPPLVELPNEQGALVGSLKGAEAQKAAREGARTIPPRENGGNCDIKNLSRGAKAYFPVYVEGANLSMGDIHFSQGDGEISFCGAIEMAGWIDIRVDLIKDGIKKYGITNPIFESGPMEPRYSEYIIFEGISVDEAGKQLYLDAHVAYRRACLNAIEYLKKFGYTGQQAYIILSTVPLEGRLSGVVDIPNACCTLALPVAIFDQDIRPTAEGPKLIKKGTVAQ